MKKKDTPKEFLDNYFKKKEGSQILKIIKKKNLLKDAYLDSLDVVILASEIKKKFKININLSNQKNLKKFEKYQSILKLIGK